MSLDASAACARSLEGKLPYLKATQSEVVRDATRRVAAG